MDTETIVKQTDKQLTYNQNNYYHGNYPYKK